VQDRHDHRRPRDPLLVHPVAELMGRVEPEEVAAWEEPMAVLAEHHRRGHYWTRTFPSCLRWLIALFTGVETPGDFSHLSKTLRAHD
jgi:hypothetical protein